jgi:hypothetical protein
LTARAEQPGGDHQYRQCAEACSIRATTARRLKSRAMSIGIGTGMLGDQFTQYNDPQGADFRALLGQIGGVVIKDISGAAVTAAEDERLKKWVPRVTDRPEVAAAKLRNMRREISAAQRSVRHAYSPDQGYKAFQSGDRSRRASQGPLHSGGAQARAWNAVRHA